MRRRQRIATGNHSAPIITASDTIQKAKQHDDNDDDEMARRQISIEKGPEEPIHVHDDDLLSDNGGNNDSNDWKSVAAGILFTSLPKWFDAGIVGLLIFGGCCGNVRTSTIRSGIYI